MWVLQFVCFYSPILWITRPLLSITESLSIDRLKFPHFCSCCVIESSPSGSIQYSLRLTPFIEPFYSPETNSIEPLFSPGTNSIVSLYLYLREIISLEALYCPHWCLSFELLYWCLSLELLHCPDCCPPCHSPPQNRKCEYHFFMCYPDSHNFYALSIGVVLTHCLDFGCFAVFFCPRFVFPFLS